MLFMRSALGIVGFEQGQTASRLTANAIATLLLLLTLLRMALVCLSVPITGYANNLDFMRQSACVGVWENYPDRPKASANWDGPVNDLVFDGDRVSGLCMHSSDNLFVWALAQLHHEGAHLQLRYVGALKLMAAAALMIFAAVQPVAVPLRLALCLGFCLVFGDIAVLTYFNTLYVDASAIIAVTFVLSITAVLAARRRPPGWTCSAMAALVLLWLGLVKSQYESLAVVLGMACAACLAGRWRMRRKASLVAAAACIGPLLFLGLNAGSDRIAATADRVDRADTLLGAVLPAATNRAQALRVLGLPPACAAAVGDNGYTPAIQQRSLCPEIAQVGRLRLLVLFMIQPTTLWRPLALAITGSRPSYLSINKFEHAGDGSLPRFRWMRATSFSNLLVFAPDALYRAILLLAGVAGSLGSLLWLRALLAEGPRLALARSGEMAMLVLGGSVTSYALVSAVFGDGTVELTRHTVCVPVGIAFMAAGALGLLGRAAGGLRRVWHSPPLVRVPRMSPNSASNLPP